MPLTLSRRSFIGMVTRTWAALSLATASGAVFPPRAHAARHGARCRGVRRGGPHPDPRPGIDASHMTPPAAVRGHPDAVAAFDDARQIPEILDGIRCQCGCSDAPEMRSLLSCYEGDDAMALHCEVCEGEARLAYRMHRRGKSLDRIRAAIDARYGA